MNTKDLTLDFYSLPTETGESTFKTFASISETLGFSVRRINVAEASQLDFVRSCVESDVVFIDATVPPDPNLPSVYTCLAADINILDHLFVYSATRFPLNIAPRNGWARYDVNDRESTLKAEDVFKSYLQRIKEDSEAGVYYRRFKDGAGSDVASLMKALTIVRNESMSYARERDGRVSCSPVCKKRIFISYRATHYEDVKTLAEQMTRVGCIVDFVRSEELSAQNELMSPMRKWYLMNQLLDRIACSDELFVCLSDDYLTSWWTIGELMLVSYLNHSSSGRKRKIKVMLYDPKDGKTVEAGKNYFIENTELFKKLSRCLSYSNPKSMGPESRKQIDSMRRFFKAAKDDPAIAENFRQYMGVMFEMVRNSMAANDNLQFDGEALGEMLTPDKMLELFDDDVNKDEFWEGLTLQLTSCTRALRDSSACNLKEKSFEEVVDIDLYLKLPMLELVNVKPSEIDANLTSFGCDIELANQITLNEGLPSVRKRIHKAPDRYLWLATRWLQPTAGSYAHGLERVNSYRVEDV